ncbi:ABC transporter ATP-binding protein [Enterococcus massiliensis]|uniref:ABC transporter ATP-binding protein n=1 Tax=Enterococcus massiliensis TaxID=1640685 RepID=UPI00065E4B3B|nr:ABC transporter ATP-binding protein [Enterococcus massiliensis]
MTEIIAFRNVEKRYGEKIVIDQLNLSIQTGEIFVLVGPSGSGKTTTLKMINALTEPTEGDVYFKGKRIKDYNLQKMRWQMGYVLQQIALFPTMTVKQNIEVIPEMLGWEKEKRKMDVDRLLKLVNLNPEQYRNRMPRELSGGEQQRIGILRAIAANPEVILMDEPFSALDPISRSSLQELVLQLHEDLGTTIVFVTHNMKEAIKLGDRIAVMRNGRLIQCDTPEKIIAEPKTKFIETFFEETGEDEAALVTVRQMMQAGFYQTTVMKKEQPIITEDTTLQEVYRVLATASSVSIKRGQEVVGQLSGQDVFAFLSRKEEADEES